MNFLVIQQNRKMASEENKEKTYPLHKVIRYRNIHKMKILLDSNKNINEKNEFGYPPLVYACEQEENDDMLELLLKQRNIDPLATDSEFQNALHILAFRGKLKWIKKFFERFPNFQPVDLVTSKGNTALILAAKMDHTDIIEYLHAKGADVNHKNEKSFTALHYAANNGYTKSTIKLLELGAEIDALDNRNCTPLMKSSGWGFTETTKILLDIGANVDIQDTLGQSALSSACRRGSLEIAELLLQNGANPNGKTKPNEYGITYTPLCTICKFGNIDLLTLLIKHGADVNYPGGFSQALFHCIKSDFIEGIKELIKANVDLRGRNPTTGNRTPLEQARKFRKQEIAELIQRNM